MQIFFKVDNNKTVVLDATKNDKVKDVKRRVQNKLRCVADDMFVSFMSACSGW